MYISTNKISSAFTKIAQTDTTQVRIPEKVRRGINKILYEMGKKYWESIPLTDIIAAMNKFGVDFDEENSEFILTGREGQDTFGLTYNGQRVSNSELILTWYRMESGKWEIVAYLA